MHLYNCFNVYIYTHTHSINFSVIEYVLTRFTHSTISIMHAYKTTYLHMCTHAHIHIQTYRHTLHYITLHKLHYITLNYIKLHYITLHYTTLHTYIHTYIHITLKPTHARRLETHVQRLKHQAGRERRLEPHKRRSGT